MKNISDCFVLNNGVKIPCVGYGTWRTPDGIDTVKAVREALDCGYRHIDTAQLYGNEESVGKGIRESGLNRSELFVTTKLKNTDQGYDSTLRAFEGSMKRLGLDYLDLYLIHWPVPAVFKDDWKQVSRDTWRAFERLYEEGLVRSIGLSNFLPHHIDNIEVSAHIKPSVDQLEIHPFFTQKETAAYCRRKGIQVQAWSPLGHGTILDNPVIKEIGLRYHKTAAQTALRWELQQDILPIPKSLNLERMAQNADIFDFNLTQEECLRITGLGETGRTGPDPDNIDFSYEG